MIDSEVNGKLKKTTVRTLGNAYYAFITVLIQLRVLYKRENRPSNLSNKKFKHVMSVQHTQHNIHYEKTFEYSVLMYLLPQYGFILGKAISNIKTTKNCARLAHKKNSKIFEIFFFVPLKQFLLLHDYFAFIINVIYFKLLDNKKLLRFPTLITRLYIDHIQTYITILTKRKEMCFLFPSKNTIRMEYKIAALFYYAHYVCG